MGIIRPRGVTSTLITVQPQQGHRLTCCTPGVSLSMESEKNRIRDAQAPLLPSPTSLPRLSSPQ